MGVSPIAESGECSCQRGGYGCSCWVAVVDDGGVGGAVAALRFMIPSLVLSLVLSSVLLLLPLVRCTVRWKTYPSFWRPIDDDPGVTMSFLAPNR